MDAFRLQLKLFTAKDATPEAETLIPVLHGFIKHHALPDLLIDVANYAHVPHGPGVVLIGHATDYYYDETKGRRGLLFSRKRQPPEAGQRLEDTFRRAFHAASVLEADPALGGKLRFETGELLFRINDRLYAPNTDATFAAVKPELEAFCARLFGAGGFALARVGDARELFGVSIKVNGTAPTLATLLERAGGPAAATA